MEIIKASSLGVNAREIICKIFIDAFFNEFGHISNDRIKLYRSFNHIFLVEKIYIAMLDKEAAGFIACTNGFTNSMEINANIFRNEFGLFKGSIFAMMLKKNFQKQPVKRGNKEGFIEIVATAPSFQKKGVATALFNHIFDLHEFDSYILEVASNNTSGISLYQKLGFNEFQRKKHLFAKQSGIDFFIWMEKPCVK
jgi:ribosomal protein S18 acetylase RimI-like enzyme